MYMSRLAALKEYAFMTALKDNGFPVPKPLAQNRHTVVMELIDAFPLRQISEVPDPAGLYADLIAIILRLAQYGLIHGDFNEFNILIKEEVDEAEAEAAAAPTGPTTKREPLVRLTPIIIDFPQMVSIDHSDAKMYFDRDVNCIKRFFQRRFHFTPDESGPFFSDARERARTSKVHKRLDVEAEASGFSRKMAKELELYMREAGVDGDGGAGREEEDEEEELSSSEEAEQANRSENNSDDDGQAMLQLGSGKKDPQPSGMEMEACMIEHISLNESSTA